MNRPCGVIIYEGGSPAEGIETELSRIRNGLTIELMKKCISVAGVDPVILATDRADLKAEADNLRIEIFDTAQKEPFHFGNVLKTICCQFDLDKVLLFSGGSAPLMSGGELQQLLGDLLSSDRVVISNNPQSADVIAFSPTSVLQQIHLPEIDNPLPWILREEGKLPLQLLPVSAGFNFDIDTPLDAVYLSMHPSCPGFVHDYTEKWSGLKERLKAAQTALAVPNSEIVLTGRVGPWIMSFINEHIPCRLRVISEERGMKALGRIDNNLVYSILGRMIDEMGIREFFAYLEDHCDAAFMDTRVLFSHWKLNPDANDRFYSDLGMVSKIRDARIREFTEQALSCRIPVILGGHSVVAGGMLVLVSALVL